LIKDTFTYNSGTTGTGTFGSTTVLSTATGDSGYAGVAFAPVATPEPTTGLLAALGLMGLGIYGWRRRTA
jgi:hypothetical protein